MELAVEFDADSEIIEALLKAGANPSSKELAHDSAICLASKKSSPCLDLLLRYTDQSLLDATDENGSYFAFYKPLIFYIPTLFKIMK